MVGRGLRPQWLHAGNSSSMVAGSDRVALMKMAAGMGARLMLRPGLALYGYLDRISQDGLSWEGEPGFAPVLEWKTQVTSLRTLRAGETVGYGNTFTATRETRLALLPVGYADGFNRLLSNRGQFSSSATRLPLPGGSRWIRRPWMLRTFVVVRLAMRSVLLGKQGRHSISAWDLADLADTIPWEVLCAISSRVPRLIIP